MAKPKIFNKIPKQVKISRTKYKIVQADIGRNLHGLIENRKKDSKITLNNKKNPIEMESTLIHEILHGLDWGLKEKQVLSLEKKLVNLFRRNKWKIVV